MSYNIYKIELSTNNIEEMSKQSSESERLDKGFISNTGSMSGVNISYGNKNTQTNNINAANLAEEEKLNQIDIIDRLSEVKNIISNSELPEDAQEKVSLYLSAATAAIEKKEPEKDIALPNLKRFEGTFKTLSSTVDSAKNIWDKINPILVPIFAWLVK